MRKILAVILAVIGLSVGAPTASATDTDCYTQETSTGTRETCYYGFPDYQRTITDCDGNHCVTRGVG